MQIRKDDMSKWRATARRFNSLDLAMADAQCHLEYTSNVRIWPFAGQWLVIAYTPTQAN